jgi:hypothetical protein
MGHRPHPNRDRALKQARRNLSARRLPATRHWSENAAAVVGMSGVTAAELLRRWKAAAWTPPADEYRLSTRRP